jgi:hypothetical protein
MAAKLTRLKKKKKIATQLHLVAESCTICSSRSRRPVRELLDTPSYLSSKTKVSFRADKVKVKLSLCFNWPPRHEGLLREWRYSSPHSLTSALNRDEWSASWPCRFTPRERAPSTHWIGGWVVPRAVLDVVVKRKIPSPRRELHPKTPIFQPVAQRYTDWAITALVLYLLNKI